jgi:hypothetical protein
MPIDRLAAVLSNLRQVVDVAGCFIQTLCSWQERVCRNGVSAALDDRTDTRGRQAQCHASASTDLARMSGDAIGVRPA